MVNVHSFRFEVSQFIENERYSTLQSLMLAKSVKECIYYCRQPSAGQVKNQIKTFEESVQKCNVTINKPKDTKNIWSKWKDIKGEFDSSTLNNLLDIDGTKRLLSLTNENQLSLRALMAQINHLGEMTRDPANYGKFSIEEYRLEHFMKLDAPGMAALNLFPTISDSYVSFCLVFCLFILYVCQTNKFLCLDSQFYNNKNKATKKSE